MKLTTSEALFFVLLKDRGGERLSLAIYFRLLKKHYVMLDVFPSISFTL